MYWRSRRFSTASTVFFKLVKPVAYVLADIDLLVREGDFGESVKRLVGIGFRAVVRGPYTVTLAGRGTIIDLYRHPSMGGLVFMDGDVLLEHGGTMSFHGVEVPSLKPYAEALATAAHAIYKEMLYTLNDYLTMTRWADERTYDLAEELRCVPALSSALRINEMVDDGSTTLPYRIPSSTWTWTRKVAEDSNARGALIEFVKSVKDRGIDRIILSKITRETY